MLAFITVFDRHKVVLVFVPDGNVIHPNVDWLVVDVGPAVGRRITVPHDSAAVPAPRVAAPTVPGLAGGRLALRSIRLWVP